ncbi:hypothetical protein LHP98_03020 [Rhodobacter sp. Har01]|uniref:hypothetical protein n=1 Tax=Rhodobacter sp. Har01 TaxID=2883999 RepID=UPI001D09617E|nr:hypothetical protein [Rhodobacter sp. Har01]MCB6177100.1 hypothetical protein [Rhodobacter sp. Har01]
MFRTARLALPTALLLAATPALAEPLQAFGFSLKRARPDVEGFYVVDGYAAGEMRSLIGLYCAGSVGDIVNVGPPKRKRGLMLQKFRSTCSGGLSGRFQGKSASFEIELMQKGEHRGRHVAEITSSDGSGNVVYLRETVAP